MISCNKVLSVFLIVMFAMTILISQQNKRIDNMINSYDQQQQNLKIKIKGE